MGHEVMLVMINAVMKAGGDTAAAQHPMGRKPAFKAFGAERRLASGPVKRLYDQVDRLALRDPVARHFRDLVYYPSKGSDDDHRSGNGERAQCFGGSSNISQLCTAAACVRMMIADHYQSTYPIRPERPTESESACHMTLYQRNGKLMWNEVAEDIVALDVENGNCFGMQDVSADVWRLLETPQSIDSLCQSLQAQYEVDESQCRQQIDELIGQMLAQGLAQKLA